MCRPIYVPYQCSQGSFIFYSQREQPLVGFNFRITAFRILTLLRDKIQSENRRERKESGEIFFFFQSDEQRPGLKSGGRQAARKLGGTVTSLSRVSILSLGT